MWKKAVFDVHNPNLLVSLAYIKTNKNPLLVFCNYIVYLLLKAPNEQLRNDELIDKLGEQFGLNMYQHVINMCTRALRDSGALEYLPNGAGYKIKQVDFDIKSFEENLLRLHEQEEQLITSIIDFISNKYDQTWSRDDTKKYLSIFLTEQENGARLFLHEELKYDEKRVSPYWYIGRYIDHLKGTDSLEAIYLKDIVNGIMVFIGVNQTNDFQQDKNQKFKGTVFYFDTKLILRYLGFSWEAQVKAIRELVNLITQEYGGLIGVFEQNIVEVKNALSSASYSYNRGNSILDDEIRTYATLNPTGASLLFESSSTIRDRIEAEPSFLFHPQTNWDSEENRKHVIDIDGLTEYVKKSHESWRQGTIDNDVAVINQINVLRKGNYASRYGGKNRLPVFITSNSELVHCIRKYAKEQSEEEPRTNWNPHALPIISDTMLLFRLWLPFANKYSDLPAITLARYSYCAQNEDSKYFDKLREKAKEFSKVEGVDLVNLSEARRKEFEDFVVANSKGDSENLTEPIIATSMEEVVKLEKASLQGEVTGLKGIVNELSSSVIELAAKPHINKLGLPRLLILVSHIWWLIVAVLVYVVSSILTGYLFEIKALNIILTAIPIVAEVILFVLGKILSSPDIELFFVKHAVHFAATKYTNKIRKTIRLQEKNYEKQIIDYCIDNTPLLKKYRRFFLDVWY